MSVRFRPRELRRDASPEELRRQLNDYFRAISAELAALSQARSVTEVKTTDYTARYGDIVRMAPPVGGKRLILPPKNQAQPNGRVTLVLEGGQGAITAEATDATINGEDTVGFSNVGTVEFRLTQTGWYAGVAARIPGIWHVNDFGAYPLDFFAANIPAGLRAANVKAIQKALDHVKLHGGTLLFGGASGGVYYTDATVGYDLAEDINVGVTLRGLSPFLCMLSCSSTTAPALLLRTTTGNLRNLYIEHLAIYGGRTGLACVRVDYCRFDEMWFWGAEQYAVQTYLGSGNVFAGCFFTETQGHNGDAYAGINAEDEFTSCVFGEACGGLYTDTGTLRITGGYGFGWKFGNVPSAYTDYWTDIASPSDVALDATFTGKFPAIIGSGGDIEITGLRGDVQNKFLLLNGCYDVALSGVRLESRAGFVGFIDVHWNVDPRLRLSVSGGQYALNAGHSGYFIEDSGGTSTMVNAVVNTSIDVASGATLTALETSAPSLFNPLGTENNVCVTNLTPPAPLALAKLIAAYL